ncbi:hypothetical protein FLONG3_544 [Fusarium longipes]|uniref:Uncharacterized protein n=1 Tax=Fusarium longipes TaxID=694270 RepID=A0A395T9J4_9HYPO|nr:hypothetical protein FLONG3_544 [Fusarium longipes]
MVYIESITLVPNQRLPLVVSDNPDYPDLDLLGNQTRDYGNDVLYNVQTNQTAQFPAVVKPPGNILLTVKLSCTLGEFDGLDLCLGTRPSQYCYLVSDWLKPEPEATEISFNMRLQRKDLTATMSSPWCVNGMTKFELYYDDGSLFSPKCKDQPAPVPLELYTLGATLPAYYNSGVPLLLLRMFVRAAVAQEVVTAEQWVALVTKICHGSAEPETGIASDTENHWLKYNTIDGKPAFVWSNSLNPAGLSDEESMYMNYGGNFYLIAWLDAYRGFKKNSKRLSLVNCYDQAEAVEVALSLGISYECIAWEYHQPFGFITRKAQLVGWGECNNPYFKQVPANKVLDEMDPNRSPFGNHAFLSWNPTIKLSPDDFAEDINPSDYTGRFAIDACAGPHLGNEVRGVWVSPTSYPLNYTDNSTYWKTRDDKYLNKPDLFPKYQHHNWTPGVTGLNSDAWGKPLKYLNEDPFKGSSIVFPTQGDFPNSTLAFGGSISDLQSSFTASLHNNVPNSTGWQSVIIPTITLAGGGSTREIKLFDDTQPAFNYTSLKISILPTLTAALSAQQARAAQVIITSTLEASDFQANLATPNETQKIHVLQADFTGLMVCMNLFIEITGYVGVDAIKDLVSAMEKQLGSVPGIDGNLWQQALD